MTDLQERTKGSIQRQWTHCLCNDWLLPEKAKALSLKKFYVDLEWTKLVGDLENYGVSMSSIYDILSVLNSNKALNILLEGINPSRDLYRCFKRQIIMLFYKNAISDIKNIACLGRLGQWLYWL